jgi:hypothetical protein
MRHIFLTTKTYTAVSTLTSANSDPNVVNHLFYSLLIILYVSSEYREYVE